MENDTHLILKKRKRVVAESKKGKVQARTKLQLKAILSHSTPPSKKIKIPQPQPKRSKLCVLISFYIRLPNLQ